MSKLKKLLIGFLTFFKIGLFTFGGGYAMISIIENNVVEKKKWISHDEFLDVIAIAESTPGPIALNSATYIGYKYAGVLGSLFCTLGVVLPSFIIIFAISFVYKQFLALEWVKYAFRGIQVGVAFLIFSTGIKMIKKMKKNAYAITALCIVIALMITLDLLAKNISTIVYILIGGALGIIIYLIAGAKQKTQKVKSEQIANGENQSIEELPPEKEEK